MPFETTFTWAQMIQRAEDLEAAAREARAISARMDPTRRYTLKGLPR